MSQTCHAFAEPGGHGRTPEDSRRVRSSTGGHARKRRDTRLEDTTYGRFGTVRPGFKSRAPDFVRPNFPYLNFPPTDTSSSRVGTDLLH